MQCNVKYYVHFLVCLKVHFREKSLLFDEMAITSKYYTNTLYSRTTITSKYYEY